MLIKILGSAPGLPILGKSNAAIWVKTEDKNILLDCGEGTSQKLLQNGLIKDKIDEILISHLHPDHISGIFMVIQMFYLQGRKKELNIYLPEREHEFPKILEMFYTFQERLTYKINFLPIEKAEEKNSFLKLIPSCHLLSYKDVIKKRNLPNKMKTFSFFLKENDKSAIYTADIGSLKYIHPYLDKIDLLIIDAFHVKAEDILKLPELTKAKIILNHGLSKKLEQSKDLSKFELADENKEYIL